MSPVRACACPRCLLVQGLAPLPAGHVARCLRCGARFGGHGRRATRAAWHAALAALILFPLAISLPILRLEQLGETHESSVWSGSIGLLTGGKPLLGLLVFSCSIVIPLAKLLTLVVLLFRPGRLAVAGRVRAWRALELAGRWGMLDVLLVSVLVAWLELGAWVTVEPGPAAAAFGTCVLLSLLASAWFDAHTLFEEAPEGAR